MRVEQLTFTRFLAAISIVIYHYGKNVYPYNIPWVWQVLGQANVGVSYFFILSGFVLIIAYQNKNNIGYFKFYKNRFARIFPIFFIGILLLLTYKAIKKHPIFWDEVAYNVLGIQAWIPSKALCFNSPSWSITVEILFYFLFPFAFNRFYTKTKYLHKIAIVAFIFFVVSQIFFHLYVTSTYYKGYPSISHYFGFYWPPFHLNEFLMGNVAGLYFIKYLHRLPKNGDLKLMLLGLVLVLFLYYNTYFHLHNGFLTVLFVPIIILMANNEGSLTSIFCNKIFIILGEISFSIYILQQPVFKFCDYYFDMQQISNTNLRFHLSVLVLILVAFLSYYGIEKPLKTKISNIKITK